MSYDYGLKTIARHTGLTGVEAKHVAKALKSKNIGFDVVDWKAMGESTRDYGDRSGAVWGKLGSMYGISKPETMKDIEHGMGSFKESQERRPFESKGFQLDMCRTVHLNRSRRSILLDDSIRAKHVFKPTNLVGVQKWMKAPNRYDIVGVDYFPKKKRTKRKKKRR